MADKPDGEGNGRAGSSIKARNKQPLVFVESDVFSPCISI